MRAITIESPVTFSTERAHYLPFVDGLRAVAILTVVGCHVGLPGFSGGYVGVDVFFVISGFLIINQIRSGLERDNFSLVSFYARRILRIHPPFIVMLVAVYLVGPFVLPNPDIYADFTRAAVLSPLMVVNVLFYLRQGYFDISAQEKPLLHTWTLSVEEQFYAVIPLMLIFLFRLGGRRFGTMAASVAIFVAVVSLMGAIEKTATNGPNQAFYLTHWRMWEFIAGGLIGPSLIAKCARLPRPACELIGAMALALIAAAVILYDARTPYPSWRAALPVAGATLIILFGLAQPNIIAARLLALRVMVAIGLVSYGWYLWHWPILSYLRISRLGEASLLPDFLGAGMLGLVLACLSYWFVETPIRRWGRAKLAQQWAGRIFRGGIAAGVSMAIVGGLAGLGGYLWITSYVEAAYGLRGKGELNNGCGLLNATTIPAHCLDGRIAVLIGDSHADTMFPGFARILEGEGLQLIYVGRGGCDPLHLTTKARKEDRHHGCANLLGSFEQLLVRNPPAEAVIVIPAWQGTNENPDNWVDMFSQFNPQTRILVIGPAPTFKYPILDCVVLSDRFGNNRDRCIRDRADVEKDRAPIVKALQAAVSRFGNVRYIDPIDLFCGKEICRPFEGNRVFYSDASHLVTQGADRVYDNHTNDFRWLAEGR